MPAKIILSLSALLYLAVLPFMEISDTHVFNPDWPGHARMHEVWQLAVHFALAVLALWLGWVRGQVRLGAAILLIVTGGFVFAYAIAGAYGGDMKYADGTELNVLGVNPAFGITVIVALALTAVLLRPGGARQAG